MSTALQGTAYTRGFTAGEHGDGRDRNPYLSGSNDRDAWNAGYDAGKRVATEERAPNTTATAGAVRAAQAVMQRYSVLDDSGAYERRNVAAIIDRETGCGELLAALEEAARWIPDGTRRTPEQRGATCATAYGVEAMINAAIARARGTAAL